MYQTVGTLPCQSLLRLALDLVFEEFPEISAIQTKVYRMLKCHWSVINHPSITQFDDISLANHDFDRVVGPDFHNVSGAESRPDLSLQTDFNDTYYSVFSQAQCQVYRVTERSLNKLRKDRANSCPDIVQQLHRDTDRLANSNWRYTGFNQPVYPDPYKYRNDQQTQTEIQDILQLKDTGAQYSSPSHTDDSSSSKFDSDIEGTENITVTRCHINRRSASSEDLYTNPTPPHKRFRTSTPEPATRQPEKEPIRCPLKEIINHRPALQIPPVNLIVAPGRQAANVQLGRQHVNAMAGRGRNQPQPPPLQGADPALVQILQMMQNRDANRDNSRKQFLMFPKECFNGQDKKLAKRHCAYLCILPKIQQKKVSRPNLKVISISWPLLIMIKHLTTIVQAIMIIVGDNAAEDAETTEALVDAEIIAILITDMKIKTEDLDAVKDNVTLITAEGVVTIIHIGDEEDSGTEMTRTTVTETIGIEILIVKVILTGVEDGIIIVEVKDIVIVEEGDDGIPINSIMIQSIKKNTNFKIQITTDHPQWDINTGTQPHMVSIHIRLNNNNTHHKCQRLLNKPLIFVNCATVKAIMIINANLQAILWHAHRKLSTKADHTVTKTLIMGTGHKVKVITMTQMGNLFSSGGSRCR